MRLLLPLLLAASLVGCSAPLYSERIPFTDTLVREWNLQPHHRQQLQYYVSHPIRLIRSFSASEQGIRQGRLLDSGGRTVEEIVIDGGTPGIVLASGPNWMAVSFHPGTYLYFVSNQTRIAPWLGHTWAADRYYLYLPDWDGRAGTVMLGNGQWSAIDHSVHAHLLVERESVFDARSTVYRQPGRILGR